MHCRLHLQLACVINNLSCPQAQRPKIWYHSGPLHELDAPSPLSMQSKLYSMRHMYKYFQFKAALFKDYCQCTCNLPSLIICSHFESVLC